MPLMVIEEGCLATPKAGAIMLYFLVFIMTNDSQYSTTWGFTSLVNQVTAGTARYTVCHWEPASTQQLVSWFQGHITMVHWSNTTLYDCWSRHAYTRTQEGIQMILPVTISLSPRHAWLWHHQFSLQGDVFHPDIVPLQNVVTNQVTAGATRYTVLVVLAT